MAVTQPHEHLKRSQQLRDMKLDEECFGNALASGAAEAASYSEGAAKSGPESGRWQRTIETFHHEVIGRQLGWERTDPLNLPTWTHPELEHAIVISSGDHFTGEFGFMQPTTKNPKGASFRNAVANNQVSLFDDVSLSGEMLNVKTWVFLYNFRSGFVYSELSLPSSMETSFIDRWEHRIILPRFDGNSGMFERREIEPEPDQDFNFSIQRR